MSLKNSYFDIPNPIALLDRLCNPPVLRAQLQLRGAPLGVSWTRRAARQLQRRPQPLLAEMQLYFSCVVKKRVLFHETTPGDEMEWLAVNGQLQIAFRAVESNSCDPVEFAANHPVRREFETLGAVKMHPSTLQIDYKNGAWVGEFSV